MSIAYCRQPGCRKEILWLTNDSTGKLAPIDAEPSFGGNIDVLPDPETGEVTAYRIVPKAERGRRPWHKSHWMTCLDPPPKQKKGYVVPRRRSDP